MREPLNRVRIIKSRIMLLNEIITDFGGDVARTFAGSRQPAWRLNLTPALIRVH